MATNIAAIKQILNDLYTSGLYLSLHPGEPSSGGQPKLYGPELIPRGVLRVSSAGVLYNPRQINMPNSQNGGRATHVGLWLSRSLFFTSKQLSSPVIVARNAQIQIPANGIKVGLFNV